MEVNKEQAEKCRDIGAAALRQGNYVRAAKMLQKSLQLYPLPGVEALYQHAIGLGKKKDSNGTDESNNNDDTTTSTENNTNGSSPTPQRSTTTAASGSSATTSRQAQQQQEGADGRNYSREQVEIVQRVLRAKEGGRGAHYRVLDIATTATENDIKKAYRKLSLKVHPDKNSAPHADEAFKAVGLAYATLSDTQKRTIYDRYGEEDPDNRGGARAAATHMRHGGREMTPEEIFQAFFGQHFPGGGMGGGGMGGGGGGGGGVHFYSSGFGGPGGGGVRFRRPAARGQQQQQQQAPGIGMLLQLLPLLVIMIFSFFSQQSDMGGGATTGGRGGKGYGEDVFFSLTHKPPTFTNPLTTKHSKVKDIPYFVSDKFLRTYYRDRYQLNQIERHVEKAYENYLVKECQGQREYKKRLFQLAKNSPEIEQPAKLKHAQDFELSRCEELADLFPDRQRKRQSGSRW